jgi:hypothetical protein
VINANFLYSVNNRIHELSNRGGRRRLSTLSAMKFAWSSAVVILAGFAITAFGQDPGITQADGAL